MKSVAISEFKARCLSLLDDVAKTGRPLLVTKRGQPIVRVVPSGGKRSIHPQDSLAGTVEELGNIIEPVPHRWNASAGILLSGERTKTRRRRR
jgi:prevent-host-death family protein